MEKTLWQMEVIEMNSLNFIFAQRNRVKEAYESF